MPLRAGLPLATIVLIMLAGYISVSLGGSLLGSVVVALVITTLSIVAYRTFLTFVKKKIRKYSAQMDLSSFDSRLRMVCRLLGVDVLIIPGNRLGELFGIAVLPATLLDRRPTIIVTALAMKLMPGEALEGAIGHELGHLLRRHDLVMAMALTMAVLLQTVATYNAVSLGAFAPAVVLATATLVSYLVFWVHRRLEFEADLISLKLVGEEKILKSLKTVEALSETISGGVKNGLFDTHPPIHERIQRVKLYGLKRRKG